MMTEKQSTEQSFTKAGLYQGDQVSPESLMSDFRVRPIFGLVSVALLAHVLLIGVFSVGYLKTQLLGDDTTSMTKEQRIDSAVREATSALREIAERHNMSPQEFSSRFGDKSTHGIKPGAATTSQPAAPATTDTPPASREPNSPIEKALDKREAGPQLPTMKPDEEDDLFKSSSPQ